MAAAPSGTLLDDVLARFQQLPPDKQEELRKLAEQDIKQRLWVPTAGPQLDAFNSKADILLFGGGAGGGKTDLVLGIGMTAHRRSLVMRRQYTDLAAITDRAIQINRTRKGFNGSIPPKLKTADGRLIDFGAAHAVGDEEGFQGQPHDFIGFDEAVQFAESQVRFLLTWLRSVDVGQRTRAILATNPPVSAEGEWLVRMFAPWLDPNHSNPAKPGELRWFVTDEDGNDMEVPSAKPLLVGGKLARPLSRSFIPSQFTDNPYLARTDYGAKLDALPEPYRSAFRDGNFMLARKDALNQIIPTAWVREAQARWNPSPPEGIPMCAMGCDPAQGGADEFVLAPRYDAWFAPLVRTPGEKVPDGPAGAGLIVSHRRDNAVVIIDMGGGYGGSTFDHLKSNGLVAKETLFAFKGSETSKRRTSDNQLGFFNARTETYWRFREALDPQQPGGSPIMLPPDPMLVADLTALTFEVTPRGIKAETKEDVVKKLGRSPDGGDAVVISWSEGQKAATHGVMWKSGAMSGRSRTPKVIRGHDAQRNLTRR